jgi:hypothetical protein
VHLALVVFLEFQGRELNASRKIKQATSAGNDRIGASLLSIAPHSASLMMISLSRPSNLRTKFSRWHARFLFVSSQLDKDPIMKFKSET